MSNSSVEENPVDILKKSYNVDDSLIYELAVSFTHDKIDKAFHPEYEDRAYLKALQCYIKHGKVDPANPICNPGFLDFFGTRKMAIWNSLGDMPVAQAQSAFANHIYKLCPPFLAFAEAHLRSSQSIPPATNGHLPTSGESTNDERDPHYSSLHSTGSQDTLTLSTNLGASNRDKIRAALNAQTKEQFHAYACQHFANDPAKQADLIADLQARHFVEYMAYIKQRQALTPGCLPNSDPRSPPPPGLPLSSSSSAPRVDASPHQSTTIPTSCTVVAPQQNQLSQAGMTDAPSGAGSLSPCSVPAPCNMDPASGPADSVDRPSNQEEQPDSTTLVDASVASSSADSCHELTSRVIRPASIWTRGEMAEFKANLSESKDALVQLECGEIVSIRIPAHPSGSNVVWEFATDHYDIGFGLSFEWASDDEPDVAKEDNSSAQEPPSSTSTDVVVASSSPPEVDDIIPVKRVNCHVDVHCGSHAYPGRGTYLLRFDNTHSLWRSKSLYYRVYYTC